MQKVLKGFVSFGLAIAMIFGVTSIRRTASVEYVISDAAAGDYYSSISAKSGTALLGQLHDLITTTHTKYTSYDECKTKGPTTDPGLDGKGVLEFYTHETIMSFSGTVGTWNREHVWCQSLSNGLWGTSGGGSDMHHIRPSESSLNSTRGNNKYGVVTSNKKEAYSKKVGGATSQLGGWVGGGAFEPLDNVKGDVARIVMYVYTHYNQYYNVSGTTNGSGGKFGTLKFTNVVNANSESDAIKLLLEWNEKDPVDEIETYRNEEVYKIQGNRNPFIDNQNYAKAIWGNGTVNPDPDPAVELERISLNKAYVSLTVGGSDTLIVTGYPSTADASVTWSTSDASVATVAGGVVTAKKAGTATITATSTKNSSIKATASVTVKDPETPPGPSTQTSGTLTIDMDSFSFLDASYDFYDWSAGGVSGIAFIYGANTAQMQFNVSKASYYLASTTATPAPIKSVTVTLYKEKETDSDREWKLLTSDTAYGEVAGKPTNGTDHGTKMVTTSGVTWTLDGEDTYFALTYEFQGEKGASYIQSIVVEYGSSDTSGGGDVGGGDVGGGEIGGDDDDDEYVNVNAFHIAVAEISSAITLAELRASIDEALAAYRILTAEEKVLATVDYEMLLDMIEAYNLVASAVNQAADKADKAVYGD